MALIRQVVDADPMKFIGNVNPRARLVVSEAMRQANDARHHTGADLGRRDHVADPRTDLNQLAIAAARLSIKRMEDTTLVYLVESSNSFSRKS